MILLHVAGVALLTLLINATTTGPLVKYLGLSKYSDLKKNLLMGLTKQLNKNVDKDIEILKTKRHFNNVDWAKLRGDVHLVDLTKRLGKFEQIEIDGVNVEIVAQEREFNPISHLIEINKKISDTHVPQ